MLERSPSEPSPGRTSGDHEVPRRGPETPSRATVASLQRQVGNRATTALLQRWGLSDLRVPLLGPIVGGVSGFVGSLWVWRPWFLTRAWDLRQRPIFSAEWDAWGHCVTAAMTASWGSSLETWLVGEGRETFQDLFGQDSHSQDSHNQAVGRAIGSAHGYARFEQMAELCFDAYRRGRLRIGPDREAAWLPWCGPHDVTEHVTHVKLFHAVMRHEGRRWFPVEAPGPGGHSPQPRHWVEAVDCGPDGTRAGGHLDSPPTPLPATPAG